MRSILAILLIILLGIALGVGVAALRIRTASWNPTLDQSGRDARPSNTKGGKPAPKVTVDKTDFDLGALGSKIALQSKLAQVPKLRSSHALPSWNDE